MRKINASKFKEQCLSLLEQLEPEGILVTKHGNPIARVIPVLKNSSDLIGSLKGKVGIHGNIFSTGIKWDAES